MKPLSQKRLDALRHEAKLMYKPDYGGAMTMAEKQARREEVLRLLDEHEQYERSLREAGAAEDGEA